MIIGKKGFLFLILTLLILLGISSLAGGKLLSTTEDNYIFQHNNLLPVASHSNPDLPLPKPSTISTESTNLRLDLEKISVNKFFIVYNVIYGNQSHTAYHLFLTDLQKKGLDKEKIANIWLESQSGQKIELIAEPTIRDFPKDQPLQWKIKIIAKFPFQKTEENHKLYLEYQDQTFVLENISY